MSGRLKPDETAAPRGPLQTEPESAVNRSGRSSAPPRSGSSHTPQGIPHSSGNAPSFLGNLFATFTELRSDTPLEEAFGALLDAFAESFENVAVGACVISESGEQLTVARSPRRESASVPDPTRLFPEFDQEWVIDLGEGSTLHVSTDDPRFAELSKEPADRLAMALRSVIERSRAFSALRAEHRETEELRLQVVRSEKLASLGQIAAGIVHELNNPLTSIIAYSDFLRRDWEKRGLEGPDTERLRRINEAAERILTFTRDLIAYSRPTASVPAPVDVHEVLDRALVFCEHVIDKNRVLVDKSFGRVRLVSGVAGQLTQVFVNLITNACQAMNEGGGRLSVTTELSEDETRVFVRVADEGHGIRDEHLPRLFEPYFTTKVDGGGTGLGLPIVQNIIKNHGGSIHAENRVSNSTEAASATGAVFSVELPVSARVTLFEEEER